MKKENLFLLIFAIFAISLMFAGQHFGPKIEAFAKSDLGPQKLGMPVTATGKILTGPYKGQDFNDVMNRKIKEKICSIVCN